MRKTTVWLSALLLSVASLLGHPREAWSAEPEATLEAHARAIDDAAARPGGQERVATRLAADLNAAWGKPPGPYSAASVTAQRAQNGWGWGGTFIANRLAQAIAQTTMKNNPAVTPAQALTQATAQVAAARAQSMGWGAIAKANGLKVGDLVSSAEKTAKAVEKADKTATDKGGQAGKSGKAGTDKADKDAKGDKAGGRSDVAADRAGSGAGTAGDRGGGGGHGGSGAGGGGGSGGGGGGAGGVCGGGGGGGGGKK